MGRRRHLCWRSGHILVEGDGFRCLACDQWVKTADKVAHIVPFERRAHDPELTNDLDKATIQEWGHAGVDLSGPSSRPEPLSG